MENVPEILLGITAVITVFFLMRVVVGIVFKIIVFVAVAILLIYLFKSETGMELAPGSDFLSSLL